MADILEAVNIQWHPGFYGAAELEFLSKILRILSKHVREEDVRAFVEKAVQMSEPGDRNNVDAVL